MSGGPYELWVTALRQWRVDPATDLSGLPSLAVDTFTPATYGRLLDHLQQALNQMMEGWAERLQRSVATTTDPHELARALVSMRPHLARRLQLARHPGLPAEIADTLWSGAVADIHSIQDQLEATVSTRAAGAASDRPNAERMLDVLRRNSFTALLDPGFPLGALLDDDSPDLAPAPLPTPVDAEPLPGRRRIMTDL